MANPRPTHHRASTIIPTSGREIVFGLVAPVGADRSPVFDALRDQLRVVGYGLEPIKLSKHISEYASSNRARRGTNDSFIKRKNDLMTAGNKIRSLYGSGDAVALYALLDIRDSRRTRHHVDDMFTHHAYFVDSLKHPKEVERLRSIYGPAFVAIGVYSPPELRRQSIVDEAKEYTRQPTSTEIDDIMSRDADEQIPLGQRVRSAFELADVIVDVSTADVDKQIKRLVQLLFGDPYLTPTRQEYGMALARAAEVASGSLARQVGAAILDRDESVLSISTNDAPKPGGGLYTEADDDSFPRGRDWKRGEDSSDWFRHRAITDLLNLLIEADILKPKYARLKGTKLFYDLYANGQGVLGRSAVLNTIDYVRAVHAETGAIVAAARNGISLRGSVLYTTTFPCHDCAKHIVATGIREVVYFSPYTKSLVAELYDDSIDVDRVASGDVKVHFHSFVGVAPIRYLEFFTLGKRKRKNGRGKTIPYNPEKAHLQLPDSTPSPQAVLVVEQLTAREFIRKLDLTNTGRARRSPAASKQKRQRATAPVRRNTTASKR